MSIARLADPSGSLQEAKEWGLDREDLLGIYRNMLMTRGVEDRGHILYKQGKIPGSFYTGRGNEASSVAVGTAMGRDDVGTPLHRDMGVHITRGVEPWRIFANYMGRADGPAKGRDGNVHMADIQLGLVAMVSHLPAMMPVAVGCALAFRIREEKRVAVTGSGAPRRAAALTIDDFAGVGSCRSSSSRQQRLGVLDTGHLGTPSSLADRAAAGFGVVVDTDAFAVYRGQTRDQKAARAAARRVEASLRMEGRTVHDDASYVPKELFEQWEARDPVERYRRWLFEHADMTREDEDEISNYVKRQLNDALERAEASPQPDPSTLLKGVYAAPEELDTPHHM
jgi:pyruvate dehydrogenase E1 component alpha subunit